MQCEHVKERWADYAAETIGPAERASIEGHLALCASCRRETAELGRMWNLLSALPQESPSAALRDRIHALVDAWRDGARTAAGADTARPERRVNWWQGLTARPAWQVAFASALLVAGFAAGLGWPRTPVAPPELSELRGEVHAMKQMVALSLLQQQSAVERLRGVNWSHDLEQPGAEVTGALLDTLRHDSNVNVRLAAVDALKGFAAPPGASALREGLIASMPRQDSPLVQIALVDALVELREVRSVNAIRTLAGDARVHASVRQRAEWAVAQLDQSS